MRCVVPRVRFRIPCYKAATAGKSAQVACDARLPRRDWGGSAIDVLIADKSHGPRGDALIMRPKRRESESYISTLVDTALTAQNELLTESANSI